MKYAICYIDTNEEVHIIYVIASNVGTHIDDLINSGCTIEECHPEST